MKIAPILLLLVLPGSAWASDSAAGGIAFQQACSRCHSARQTPNPEAAHGQSLGALKREAHAGPDLTAAYKKRGVEGLRAWVKDPTTNENHQNCDPRRLRAGDVNNLIAFLDARVAVEALPREQQQKKDFESMLANTARRPRHPLPSKTGGTGSDSSHAGKGN